MGILEISQIVGIITQVAALGVSIGVFWWNSKQKRHEAMYAQANSISVRLWKDANSKGNNQYAVICNRSDNMIYDVVLAPGVPNKGTPFIHTRGTGTPLPPVPSGQWCTPFSTAGLNGMCAFPWVAIAFTDSRGQSWIRDAMGHLSTIKQSPLDAFGTELPATYADIIEFPIR